MSKLCEECVETNSAIRQKFKALTQSGECNSFPVKVKPEFVMVFEIFLWFLMVIEGC